MTNEMFFSRKYAGWTRLMLAYKELTCSDILIEYSNLVYNLNKCHGWTHTVKVLKELNSIVRLRSLNQDERVIESLWLKLDKKSGIPKSMKNTLKLWNGGHVKETIEIFNMVQLFRTEPCRDISSIELGHDGLSKSYIEDFRAFSLRAFKRPIDVPSPTFHFSAKSGPNGPIAIVSSAKDAIALSQKDEQLKLFEKLCKRLDCNQILESAKALIQENENSSEPLNGEYHSAKLAFLSDNAGKTRVVYILSYWFQALLKPLHHKMMEWLRKQPQDGTFGQTRAAEKVKQWCKESQILYSFNLTSATDRWPRDHQRVVVESFAGKEQGDLWYEVLSKIKPYHDGRYIEYKTGQPMGAYASWAALAMTHHILIRQIFFRLGMKPEYVVLGDAVVLKGQRPAEEYVKELATLGVTISKSKSVYHKYGKPTSAEFAKQIFCGDKTLTPLTPKYLDLIFRKHQYWYFPIIINEMIRCDIIEGIVVNDDEILFPPLVNRLFKLLPPKERLKALISIGSQSCVIESIKVNNELATTWVKYANPWKVILFQLEAHLDLEDLRILSEVNTAFNLYDRLNAGDTGNIVSGTLLHLSQHPLRKISYQLFERAEFLLYLQHSKYGNEGEDFLGIQPFLYEDVILMDSYSYSLSWTEIETETLEDLLTKGRSPKSFIDRQIRRAQRTIDLILEVYRLALRMETIHESRDPRLFAEVKKFYKRWPETEILEESLYWDE